MPLRNRKASANTHDKRHENGLAPPSKKLAKPKLDSLIAQNTNGSLVNPAAARILGDADDDSDDQSGTDGGADGIPPATTMAPSRKTSSDGGSEGQSEGSAHTPPDDQEPLPLASAPQDASNGHAQRHGSFSSSCSMDISTTIISPHSLRDVVTLLLFLLQLPPTLLTAVQMCFAAVNTFGENPFAGWTINSLTSWHDWNHGRHGNPSFVTICVSDFIFWLLWYSIASAAPILEEFILDGAQGVTAMYLGGATSVRGGANHILVCILIIGLPHFLRINFWPFSTPNPVDSLIPNTNLGRLSHVPIFFSSHHRARGKLRTFLEIHIIAQGIVRVVRRWFDRQPGTSSTRKVDPEAAASSTTVASAVPNDSNSEGARNASTDGRPPGLPPATKDKEKSISSGKKRRKQANFVRSQQPLWAAVASTKISVRREPEHTQASGDALDAVTADAFTGEEVIPSRGEDRVWIERIDHSGVWFDAILETRSTDLAEVKHIAVRVNGARWSQFEAKEMERSGNAAGIVRVFKGKIYGLSPSENFFLEFIEGAECRVFYSVHLATRTIANSETGTTIAPAQPPDSMRPSSPVTTLKKSIAAADNSLTEIKNRLRKTRQDRRKANTALKREVDQSEARLSPFSNADDRQRQRQTQYMHNIKQAEEAIAQLNLQLDIAGDMPEHEQEIYESAKRDWDHAKSQRAAAREDFDSSKAEAEKELGVKRAAISSDHQKKERLEARLAKLEQTRDNLISSNLRTQKDKLHREHLRSILLNTHQAKERDILNSIQHYESARHDQETRLIEAQQQLYYLEHNFVNSLNGTSSLPPQPTTAHTPDPSFAGLSVTNPHRAAAFANVPQFPIGTAAMQHGRSKHSSSNSVHRPATRGRSSSMLSEISGFTEDETEPASLIGVGEFGVVSAGQVGAGIARNSSAGSTAAGSAAGGTAGSGSGSRGDPKSPGMRFSPVVGNAIGAGGTAGWNGTKT